MISNSFSNPILFPKIKALTPKNELIDTNTDDVIFAEKQLEKIDKVLFNQKLRKIKLSKRHYNRNNIYHSYSDKTNHFILKNLKPKSNFNNIKNNRTTSKIIDLYSNRNFSKSDINNINHSLLISQNLKDNNEIKVKMNLSKENMNQYIDNIKIMCLDSYFSKILKKQSKNLKTKHCEYEKNLKRELLSLSQDIKKFDEFKIQNKKKLKNDEDILNELRKKKKILNFGMNKLSHEYRETREQIRREIQIILDLRLYANFIHKLLGNDQNMKYNDIENNINFFRLNDKELNILIINIFSTFKSLLSENELDNSLNKLLEDEDKINIIFKIMEDSIIQINNKLEEINNKRKIKIINNINLKKELKNKIEKNKNEYNELLNEYQKENQLYIETNQIFYDGSLYIKKLLLELFEYINDIKTKNKENYDDKYFLKEIIAPLYNYIKQKENTINQLINEIEIYNKEDKVTFQKIINKLKENNKIKKYMEEQKIKEIQNANIKMKNNEKVKHLITGRNKYKIQKPFSKIKKKIIPNLNNKMIDDNLMYY